MILSLWAIPNQTIDQIWPLSHSLSASAFGDALVRLH